MIDMLRRRCTAKDASKIGSTVALLHFTAGLTALPLALPMNDIAPLLPCTGQALDDYVSFKLNADHNICNTLASYPATIVIETTIIPGGHVLLYSDGSQQTLWTVLCLPCSPLGQIDIEILSK